MIFAVIVLAQPRSRLMWEPSLASPSDDPSSISSRQARKGRKYTQSGSHDDISPEKSESGG